MQKHLCVSTYCVRFQGLNNFRGPTAPIALKSYNLLMISLGSQVSTWIAVVGERFKTPLPPAVLRSVGVPACKGAMAEPNLDSASWDQPPGRWGDLGGEQPVKPGGF